MNRKVNLHNLIDYLPNQKFSMYASYLGQCQEIFLQITQNIQRDVLYDKIFSLFRKIKILELSFSQVQIQDFNEFSQAFQQLTELSDLKIILNNCKNEAIYKTLREILQYFKDLKSLSITIQFCSVPEKEFQHIIETIQNNFLNLELINFQIYQSQINQNSFALLAKDINNLNLLKRFILNTNNKIGVQGANELALLLQNITQIQVLDLVFGADDKIGESGLIALSKSIQKLDNLKQLKLSILKNNVQTQGLVVLVSSIKMLTNLQFLSLNIIEENIQNDFAEQFGQCLENLSSLKVLLLNIKITNIGQQIGIALGKSLNQLSNLHNLQISIDAANNIQSIGCCALAQSFQNLLNLQKLKISINQNEIGPEGVAQIGEGIKNMLNLQILHFYVIGNQFLPYGAQKLGEGLEHLINLIELEFRISEESQIQAQGAFYLGKGIQNLRNLKYLYFSLERVKLQDEGIIGFSQGFEDLSNLIKLEFCLYGNSITKNGYQGLGQNIQKLKNIKILNFSSRDFNLSAENISELAQGFRNLTSLKKLILRINLQSVIGVYSYLHQIPNLEYIYFGFIEFFLATNNNEEIIKNLIDSISKVKSLRVLYLSYLRRIQQKFIIQNLLRKNKKLISISSQVKIN
ncbi:hypothetical protein ABPG72_011555 [Tetrahymena utriculariae]